MKHSFVPLSALMLAGTFASFNTAKGSTEEKKKPNILFLFADDQRADAMGCSGNTYIRTPNIDKLAENGVRFTNNYVMGGHHGAICAPSRAMLLTGKSLFHVYDKLDALVYLYDIFPTLTDLCKLPAPDGVDGKDFTPVIQGKKKGVRSSLYTVCRNTARAVRTDEWKLIRYPQRDYTQLFDLKMDPLEIYNLAAIPENKPKVDEMMALLKDWYTLTNDTATMYSKTILPLEYDYKKLKQIPDNNQPEYILNRYFKGVDLTNIKKTEH